SAWGEERLARAFPWGQWLAEGAFKQVFRVWNRRLGRMEALSVMDIDAIAASGNGAVVSQEIRIGALAAALAGGGALESGAATCPNFVSVFGVFRSPAGPLAALWGSAENRAPLGTSPGKLRFTAPSATAPVALARPGRRVRVAASTTAATAGAQGVGAQPRPQQQQGHFLYTVQELCERGDVEEFIRGQPNGQLEIEEIRRFLFQMVVAVYAARRVYTMRHYDLKLLNFLVKDILPPQHDICGDGGGASIDGRCNVRASGGESVTIHYGCGRYVFELRMPRERAMFIKLADFGTADVDASTLGQPIQVEHFTTLENVPPEQLVLGSRARQDFANDTFSLGLAVLHLFTGEAPYEELLGDVLCPRELRGTAGRRRSGLAGAWHGGGHEYDVILRVMRTEEDDDGEDAANSSGGGDDLVLYDTFYRYLVLLGVPALGERGAGTAGNAVWAAVDALAGGCGDGGGGGMAGRSAAARFRRRFAKDRA
ncbi:unnamed protein product, partial [Phaeothamnion confervicola]